MARSAKRKPPDAGEKRLGSEEKELIGAGAALRRVRLVESTAMADPFAVPAATKGQDGERVSALVVFAVLKQVVSHTDDEGCSFVTVATVRRECLGGNGSKTIAAAVRALVRTELLVPITVRRYGRDFAGFYVPWSLGAPAGRRAPVRSSMGPWGALVGAGTGAPAGAGYPHSAGQSACPSCKGQGTRNKHCSLCGGSADAPAASALGATALDVDSERGTRSARRASVASPEVAEVAPCECGRPLVGLHCIFPLSREGREWPASKVEEMAAKTGISVDKLLHYPPTSADIARMPGTELDGCDDLPDVDSDAFWVESTAGGVRFGIGVDDGDQSLKMATFIREVAKEAPPGFFELNEAPAHENDPSLTYRFKPGQLVGNVPRQILRELETQLHKRAK